MAFFLKKNILTAFLLLTSLTCQYLPAQDSLRDDDVYGSQFDEFEEDAFLEGSNQSKACPTPPATIASLLIGLDAVSILEEQFYLESYPLTARPLVSLPIFLPLRSSKPCYEWTIGSHLFWNQTSAMFFTRKSSSLCSYLGINEQTLLDKLSGIALIESLGIKVDQILPLFKNMTINERRFGLMFHAQREYERFRFRLTTPLYYFERNFFLTEQEKTAIEQALGQTTDAEQMEFAQKHLINDKVGLGDSRIVVDYKLCPEGTPNAAVGLFVTVPTAFTFASGLLGSEFKACANPPVLDFVQLFDLIACEGAQGIEKAKKIGENFALGALDTFSAIVLNRPLGNYGHFGIGGQWTSETPLSIFVKLPWAENVTMKSRVSLEYFVPATEQRFFVTCNNEEVFAALGLNRPKQEIIDNINNSPEYTLAVLAFLEKELTQKFYPFPLKAKVAPGVAFQWTSKLFYETKKWGLYLGTDTWARTGERITSVKGNKAIPQNLNWNKAQQGFGYQSKILGGLFYKMVRNNKDITLSVNADDTILSSGIGRDFTVSLNLEFNF